MATTCEIGNGLRCADNVLNEDVFQSDHDAPHFRPELGIADGISVRTIGVLRNQ
jgi:hypothetical protein